MFDEALGGIGMWDAPLAGALSEVHRLVAAEQDRAATDGDLLERFVVGQDESAFATLLERHGAMVLGACRRELRHPQDAEDAFQATFLVLARRAASVRKRQAVGSWLHGVAIRTARNMRRSAIRRSMREDLTPPSPPADAVAELTWREVQTALDEELERLPERFRAALVLCCLEGRSRDEAARHLGWSLGALKGRLERGRELLRARLIRRGVTLSAACLAGTLVPDALAAVPGRLAVPTIQAARSIAAGKGVSAGLVSAQVMLLADKASMLWLPKVKILLALALTVALAGAGWLALGGTRGETGEASSPAPVPRAVSKPERVTRRQAMIAARADGLLPAPRKEVKVGPVESWRLHMTLKGFGSPLHAVAFAPDGRRVAAGSGDGRIKGWDCISGKESFQFPGVPGGRIRSLVFAPDGKTLASGHDQGNVRVWDIDRKRIQREAALALARGIRTLMFRSEDPKVLLWSRDGGAVEKEMWEGSPRSLLAGLAPPAGRCDTVRCAALSPDARTAVWGMEDGSVRVHDTTSRTERARFQVHKHPVWCVGFSPDGRLVASIDHFGAITVQDVETGRERARSHHGNCTVLTLAFSPDGALLATGSGFRDIRLWEVKTGKARTFHDHAGGVGCLAFSPDGQFLASASIDGTVKLWTSFRD
jgi:RNA polymerase sigma factor (sigma-70 family)